MTSTPRPRQETPTGSLVIVEAGAAVPRGIFSQEECSDHAVVRQSEGESLPDLVHRAQRCVWEFIASSVRLSHILVLLNDAVTEADMVGREVLGRSLLELGQSSGARLTFQARTGDHHLSAKLLKLTGALIEGTHDRSVCLAVGPRPVAGLPLAEMPANAA